MQTVNYNEISKIYDDVREGEVVLINHFLQELPPDEGLRVLDIGCGTGNYTDLFQKLTKSRQYQVYGIEPSEGMLGKARLKNNQIVFKQATATDLPFEGDFFDFVYMTDVIHHVPDICRMFCEIQRILKPRGKACIFTQSHRQIAARPIARYFPGTVRVDQERYPDIDQIIAAAQCGHLPFLKQEVLFEGQAMELDTDYLELVRKKGWSMLHLLSEQEYRDGLGTLEKALEHGPLPARMAGETLVWFVKQ